MAQMGKLRSSVLYGCLRSLLSSSPSLCPSNKAILRAYYISDETDVISLPLGVGTWRNEGAPRITSFLQHKLRLPSCFAMFLLYFDTP